MRISSVLVTHQINHEHALALFLQIKNKSKLRSQTDQRDCCKRKETDYSKRMIPELYISKVSADSKVTRLEKSECRKAEQAGKNNLTRKWMKESGLLMDYC